MAWGEESGACDTPVPQGDHTIGVPAIFLILLGQPPVADFQHTTFCDQQVGTLDVAVQHVVPVDVRKPLQQLLHVALRSQEGEAGRAACEER